MRIGLPCALSYYEYAPLWRTFFEALGAKVVASGPTTRATLQVATSRATADLCFPAKVYVGHLLALADQVDLLFVPSLRRPAPAATHCAKIIGLPDLARSVLPEPSRLLEVDLDLDKGRLAMGASSVGAAQKLLELSLDYAKQRVQFGKPIAEFQAIQFMLADMATQIYAGRQMVYHGAWLRDTTGRSVIKEASMAKLYCTEMANRVADMAVQIHGGMGYMKELPIERFYRDLRLTRIYEGTSEIQRLVIARELLRD